MFQFIRKKFPLFAVGFLAWVCLTSVVNAQYRVESAEATVHPIDQRFEGKLDFSGTNLEMIENINEASKAWNQLIKENSDVLREKLPSPQKETFLVAQRKWQEAYDADFKFFFQSGRDLGDLIGREGTIVAHLGFMNKVRVRALSLSEYVAIFTSE